MTDEFQMKHFFEESGQIDPKAITQILSERKCPTKARLGKIVVVDSFGQYMAQKTNELLIEKLNKMAENHTVNFTLDGKKSK
jgi:ATP-dependent helicase/DNAse subunit B